MSEKFYILIKSFITFYTYLMNQIFPSYKDVVENFFFKLKKMQYQVR